MWGERVDETQRMVADEGFAAETPVADVTFGAGCKSISDHARGRFGRIDVLHCNVGNSQGDGEASELALENWAANMTLNLDYLTCKHVLPTMREQRSGVIIGIPVGGGLSARG